MIVKRKIRVAPRKRMKLKLETGFEPPPRMHYDFAAFRKGQSHHISNEEEMLRMRNAAYAYARRKNLEHEKDAEWSPIEFRCSVDEEVGSGWRLFRTE